MVSNGRQVLGFVFVLATGLAQAATVTIDGPANLRDHPNGRILLSINDGVDVECQEQSGEWYRVRLTVRVSPASMDGDAIRRGQHLTDLQGRSVGTSRSTVPMTEVKRYWDGVSGRILGYTHRQNLKGSTATRCVAASGSPGEQPQPDCSSAP
jgi:hypothetical protein